VEQRCYLYQNGSEERLSGGGTRPVLASYSGLSTGCKLEADLNGELSSGALKQALTDRSPPPGLLLHTDRGTEFRALKMRDMLARHEIVYSMSRSGCCTDNAEVESFFKSLKGELLHATSFVTLRQLRHRIKHYIERFYNTERLHSGLGYRTPLEFESAN
jgi:putative transposase